MHGFIDAFAKVLDVAEATDTLYFTSYVVNPEIINEVPTRTYRLWSKRPRINPSGHVNWDESITLLGVICDGEPVVDHEFTDKGIIGLSGGRIIDEDIVNTGGSYCSQVRFYQLKTD